MNFKLLQSKKGAGFYDVVNERDGIALTFKKGAFNETQQAYFFGGATPDVMKLARSMREMTEWLQRNHPEMLKP